MKNLPHWSEFIDTGTKTWTLDPDKFEAWLAEQGFEPHPSRPGEWISASCPDCGEGVGSKGWRFMVDAGRGLMSCFGCGLEDRRRNDPFQLVMDMDGCDLSTAQLEIGDADVVTISDWDAPEQSKERLQVAVVHKDPDASGVLWWDGYLPQVAWMQQALQAVIDRGYSAEFLRAKSIGFALNGRYEGRVIIPVFLNGRFAWLQAWDWTRTSDIKYHSPTKGDGMLRQNLVYQIDQYCEAETIVVCEGMFNAWAAELAGYAAVATFGKGMTDPQFNLLVQCRAKLIILAYDDDARSVAVKRARQLAEYGRRCHVVRYPDGRDLDDHTTHDVQTLLVMAQPPHWYDDALEAKSPPRRIGAAPRVSR